MRREVFWSRDALDELKESAAYIAMENPAAAARVEQAIRITADNLGATATGRPGRVSATYEKIVPRLPYIIAYALAADAVIILRVIHGARDWPPEDWPE